MPKKYSKQNNRNSKSKCNNYFYTHLILKIIIFFSVFFILNLSGYVYANTLSGTLTIPINDYLNTRTELGLTPANNFKDINFNDNYVVLTYSEEFDRNIFAQNENMKINPASVTKMVTSILALENFDINGTVTITKDDSIVPKNYVSVPLIPGEKVTISDLLHYTLIPSCNDAAKTLGNKLEEPNSTYLDKANSLFKKLNMTNTHFTNPYGFADPNHYTTASDLLKLTKYCLENDTFKNIISKKQVNIPQYASRGAHTKQTTNLYLIPSPYTRSDVLGVKTGYNELGGYWFISYKYDETASAPNKYKIINIVGKLNNIDERYIFSNSAYLNASSVIQTLRAQKINEDKKKEELETKLQEGRNRLQYRIQDKFFFLLNESKNIINNFKPYLITGISLFFLFIIFKPRNKNKDKNKGKDKDNSSTKRIRRNTRK